MMGIAQQLRKAMKATKLSRYAIARGSGVDYAVVSRFLDELSDIRLSTAGRLAEYLNLELKPARKAKKQRKS